MIYVVRVTITRARHAQEAVNFCVRKGIEIAHIGRRRFHLDAARESAPDGPERRPLASSVVRDITFDCADPSALARFWGEVTGLPVIAEPQPGYPDSALK